MLALLEGIDTSFWTDAIQMVVFIGSLAGAFLLGIWKGFKKLQDQFKPNGGSSLRDAIDRIERKLHIIDARQISLFDLSLAGVYITDIKGHCTYVSPSWCELTGLIPVQAMGDGWVAGISDEDREHVFTLWHKSVERGAIFESKYKTITGKSVVSRASAMYHPVTKEVMGYIGKIWEENDRRD
jgi:PAS domain S-box-containing protein